MVDAPFFSSISHPFFTTSIKVVRHTHFSYLCLYVYFHYHFSISSCISSFVLCIKGSVKEEITSDGFVQVYLVASTSQPFYSFLPLIFLAIMLKKAEVGELIEMFPRGSPAKFSLCFHGALKLEAWRKAA